MAARLLPLLLLVFLGSLFALPARADVEFEVPPDWAEQGRVDSSAVVRANEWASALGGVLERTEGSASVDEFVETLALIAFPEPMDAAALESDEAAQSYLDQFMSPLVGDAQAAKLERVALAGSNVVSIQGHYVVGGNRLEVVMVPDGTETRVVIVAALESEQVLYAPIMSSLITSIRGGAAPVVPFDVGPFRTKYVVMWLFAFAASFFASIAVFSERKGDYKRTAGFAALIILGLAVLAAIATWMTYADAAASLEAGGSSVRDLAGEVFGVGALGALIIFGAAQVVTTDEGPIQSAPTASTIVSAPPASHAPPPSHAPSEDDSGPEAIELPDVDDDAPTMIVSSKRVPPPPSSAARRVATTPVKAARSAKLEPAREEPKETVKLPSHPPKKG